MDQQRQQRPSLSYFLFLSVLFWVISSNNAPSDAFATRDERDQALERMRSQLQRRQAKREGLAQWLGVGNRTLWDEQHTSKLDNGTVVPINGSFLEPIEFKPDNHVNNALLPRIQQLTTRSFTTGETIYPQNLTGFVRGDWRMETGWTWEKLGLPEAFNTTEVREEVVQPKANDTRVSAGMLPPRVEDNPASPAQIVRRQLPHNGNMSSNGTTFESIKRFVNVTVTTNRTEARGDFDYARSGKVSFNLREEQTRAVGPFKTLKANRPDGELLVLNSSAVTGDWHRAGLATYLRGDVTLSSHDGEEDIVLDIEGTHFLSQGTFYAFATPQFIRSHLFDSVGLPSPDYSARGNLSAVAAGHVALKEVDRRIVEDLKEIEDHVRMTNTGGQETGSTSSGIAPSCIYTLYGSISPLPSYYTPDLYAEYYASLFHPTGSSLRPPPTPSVDYLLYSDNCGLVLSGRANVVLTVTLWNRATTYAILLGCAEAAIVWFLVSQMERSGPGSTAKIAYTTIGVQAAMDAYFFILQFTVGVVTNTRASLPLLVPAFFALISSLVFGMRYATSVRAAAPPPPTRPRPPPPPTAAQLAARAAESRADAEGNTEPATAASIVAADPDPSDWPFVAVGLLSALAAGTVIIIWGWIPLIVILLFSYWIPQIVLNVQRGAARLTLRRDYVIGTTIARLVLPTYFWGYKDNVLAIETSPWILGLIAYSGLQATVLVLQDSRLGARFFIPHMLIKKLDLAELETWNYHPLLPSLDDLESSVPSADDNLHAKEDCPICLSPIQLVPTKEDEANVGLMAARDKLRWSFMVPPCHHVAHTECLTHWLGVKSVCPVCRARLPPL